MRREPDLLKPELRERLEQMISQGVLTNDRLSAILNSLGKKHENRQKKKIKKLNGQESPAKILLKNPVLISYEQSLRVWQGLTAQESLLQCCAPISTDRAFSDPRYNFKKAVLNGLSTAEMAQIFPGHNWGPHLTSKKKNTPGYYLVSLENPLLNLPKEKELALHPEQCFRLDFNLTIELMLTMYNLGDNPPQLFYRTTLASNRCGPQEEICVGLDAGKLKFVSESRARKDKKMGVILVKIEEWAKND